MILCMSAALGGVLAAWVGLPETLGYIAGGMAVGRSGANLIRMVRGLKTKKSCGQGRRDLARFRVIPPLYLCVRASRSFATLSYLIYVYIVIVWYFEVVSCGSGFRMA